MAVIADPARMPALISLASRAQSMVRGWRGLYSLHLSEEVMLAALPSKKGVRALHARPDRPRAEAAVPGPLRGPAPQHITALEGAYYQNACVTEPLHLHGAFEIPDTYEGYGREPYDLVRAALFNVGGKWDDRARQLKAKRMYGPMG